MFSGSRGDTRAPGQEALDKEGLRAAVVTGRSASSRISRNSIWKCLGKADSPWAIGGVPGFFAAEDFVNGINRPFEPAE